MSEEAAKLLDQMLDRENELSPGNATFKGIHDYDELWDDPGPEGLAAYLAFVDDFAARVNAAARGASGDDALDLALARSHLAHLDVHLRTMDTARRNPLGIPSGVVSIIFIMFVRNYAPLEERLGAIRARLEKVPAYCAEAKKLFRKPVALFVSLAAEAAAQVGPFLTQVIPAGAEKERSPQAAALRAAGEKAAAAIADFMAHVRGLPTRPDFAAGREAFDRLLAEHHLLDFDADKLQAFGEDALVRVELEMARLARKIRKGATAAQLVEEMKQDHPNADGVLDFYRHWMDRSRRFVVERDICALPEGEILEVIPTPEFERPFIPYAAYMSPAPYEKEQRGFFYVTPVDPSLPADVQRQKLSGHNNYKVPVVALHEGYPGHHLQLCWANRVGRRIRREAHSNVFVEGWALYCEEMMREKGFYENDRVLLGQKRDTLWRAVRVVVDVALHTGQMSFDQAVAFMMDRIGMERVNAEAEVKRYCYSPTQPMSYLVGKHEIMALRDDYFRRDREATLRDFHNDLLALGSMPVKLAREAVFARMIPGS